MGDKSPRAKDRQKKQASTHKNDLKTAAAAKAAPPLVKALKSGR